MKVLFYRLNRFIVRLFARPSLSGADNLPDEDFELIYVLHHRAVTDLAVLEMACEQGELTSPFDSIQAEGVEERNRFFSLFKSKAGRMTMPSHSDRMQRLLSSPNKPKPSLCLCRYPCFWGRAMSNEGSWFSNLTSEDWAVTGRFKRLLNLIINRRNILVHTGRPICIQEITQDLGERTPDIITRRTARLLRVRLRQQKETTLGPDFFSPSHLSGTSGRSAECTSCDRSTNRRGCEIKKSGAGCPKICTNHRFGHVSSDHFACCLAC